MKLRIKRLDSTGTLTRTIQYWIPTLLSFGLVQVLVQAFSLLAGLLIIRSLTKGDYAVYTLVIGMTSLLAVLSNSGITAGVMAVGGRVWNDGHRLCGLMAIAAKLRARLLAWAAIAVLPFLWWSLYRYSLHPLLIAFLCVAALAIAALQTRYSLSVIPPRLLGDTSLLKQVDLVGAAVRATLCGVAALLFFNVIVALAITAAGFMVQLDVLRRNTKFPGVAEATTDPELRRYLVANIRRQIPNEIYGVFNGQLALWLVVILGRAETVAEFGALSRLAIVFTVLGATLEGVIVPAYVKTHARRDVARKLVTILSVYVALASVPVILCTLSPRTFVAILGPRYVGLDRALVLMAFSTVAASLCGVIWGLNAARGWILSPRTAVTAGLGTQAIMILLADVSTVGGVLLMNLVCAVVGIGLNLALSWRRISQLDATVATDK
jgi:hypothetical protein